MVHQVPSSPEPNQITYACKFEQRKMEFAPVRGATSAESAVRQFLWSRRYAPGKVLVKRSDGQVFGPYRVGY